MKHFFSLFTAVLFLCPPLAQAQQAKGAWGADIAYWKWYYTNSTDPQSCPRISIGPGGEFYAASIINLSSHREFYVDKSTDGGITWPIYFNGNFGDNITTSNESIDICIVGPAGTAQHLLIASAWLDNTTGRAHIVADDYGGGGTYTRFLHDSMTAPSGRSYASPCLATDIKSPIGGMNYCYSLGYIKPGATDSVIVISWNNALASSVPVNRGAYGYTTSYIRHLSIAYSSCSGNTTGRLGVAWDQQNSNGTASEVHVRFGRGNDGYLLTLTPESILPNAANPSIAMSLDKGGGTGSAGNEMRAMVLYEQGNTVLGNAFDNVGSGAPVKSNLTMPTLPSPQSEPSVTWNPHYHNWDVTLRAGNTLPHLYAQTNAGAIAMWWGNYRNASAPFSGITSPRIESSMKDGKSAYVWTDAGNNYFDTETSTLDIQDAAKTTMASGRLFPNPASGKVMLQVSASAAMPATITVIDMAGRQALIRQVTLAEGDNQLPMDVGALPAGPYQVRVSARHELNIMLPVMIIK